MFRRRRSTDDFAEEIKAHLELEAEELKRGGLTEEEARRKARVEFGSVRAAQELFYLKDRVEWFDNLAARSEVCDSPACEESWFRCHRNSCPGSGHRRERGHLRFCGRRAAGAAAVCESQPVDVGERKRCCISQLAALVSGLP
jgi:hypothetical protein